MASYSVPLPERHQHSQGEERDNADRSNGLGPGHGHPPDFTSLRQRACRALGCQIDHRAKASLRLEDGLAVRRRLSMRPVARRHAEARDPMHRATAVGAMEDERAELALEGSLHVQELKPKPMVEGRPRVHQRAYVRLSRRRRRGPG